MSERDDLHALGQRYSRAIDARDMDELTALFDPEGSVDGARGTLSVPDYLEAINASPRVFAGSMHVLGEPLVEHEDGSDTARLDTYAIVYQLDRLEGGGDMVLGMRYLDDVRRVDGAWRIHHRRAVMLWTRDRA